ncbi:MAG: hypothetical protein MUQ42_02490 [OM182 bacterium]|nr:hypothetical protein [OM182 bacterium]
MKLELLKTSALATGIALAFASIGAQAATQPSLTTAGASATAKFMGGATVNDGASYLAEVPAEVAADFVATIAPAAGDVGKEGGIVVIAEVGDLGFFIKLSGGIWIPWDGSSILPTVTKTLTASESVNVLDDLVGNDTALAGLTIKAYVGYYTGAASAATITYTALPMEMKIAEKAASSCPTNTTSLSGVTFAGKSVCQLPAGDPILSDTHLTNNFSYFFDGNVFVGADADTAVADKVKLTIDAGTTIFATEGAAALTVRRGGMIFANGSKDHPIIMTSELDVEGIDALNTRGAWGGLVVSGSATLNSADGFGVNEGVGDTYGGGTSPRDNDNSGALTYLQIKYAGYAFSPTNELNSLALSGVGNSTIVDFVQTHNGADDGIELYGGTVNAKHLLMTGTDDDALDWVLGYSGKLQHILIDQTNAGDNCIEADNLSANPTATPRSMPTVSNLTCVGSSGMSSNGHAFELKAGTGMKLSNVVLGGEFPVGAEGCIRIAGTDTFTQSGATIAELNGTLEMRDSRITTQCGNNLEGGSVTLSKPVEGPWNASDWYGAQTNSTIGEVDLGGKNGWANGSLLNAIPANIPSDSFFDQVDYIGAVKDESSDWTKGWSFTGYK